MILVVDSGSTKAHWRCINNPQIDVYTQGVNPYYISEIELEKVVRDAFYGKDVEPEQIYFFGAGCNSPEKNQIIINALNKVWHKTKVKVYSDVMASCLAVSQGKEAICCILGTGSNSCYFDGRQIVENVSPLGFILGDEGSGAYLGKKLLNYLFKTCLDMKLKKEFSETYGLDVTNVIKRTYNDANPNKFLASFVPFIKKHQEHEDISNLIEAAFDAFIRNNVLMYHKAKELPVNFTGSVAYCFKSILEKVVVSHGLSMGTVIQYPIDGLHAYYKYRKED